MTSIRVGHLYPDYLNIYADRGNIAVFARRAAWRGHELDVTAIGMDDAIVPGAHDLYYIGGGQDREQLLVAENLAAKAEPLIEAVTGGGAALLAVCGGYQLLGRGYRGFHGEDMPGVGLAAARDGRRRAADDRRRAARVRARARRRADARRLREPRRPHTPRSRAPSRSDVSSPASATTARAATKAAGSAARSGRICTARCCRATRGSPTGCSSRRSRTAPAASRRSSQRYRTSSSRARTTSPRRARMRAAAEPPSRAPPSGPSRPQTRSGAGTSPLPV